MSKNILEEIIKKKIERIDLLKKSISLKNLNEKINEKWKSLFKLKQEANIAIEEKRSTKEIGSSLEADIELSVNSKQYELLEGLDLAEYFITSNVIKIKNKIEDQQTKIIVKKSEGNKCPRCWKILKNKCTRCEEVINNS